MDSVLQIPSPWKAASRHGAICALLSTGLVLIFLASPLPLMLTLIDIYIEDWLIFVLPAIWIASALLGGRKAWVAARFSVAPPFDRQIFTSRSFSKNS